MKWKNEKWKNANKGKNAQAINCFRLAGKQQILFLYYSLESMVHKPFCKPRGLNHYEHMENSSRNEDQCIFLGNCPLTPPQT